MFILIKDNKDIIPYKLNTDICYKGIKIYRNNNRYYISLGNDLYFSDNSKHKQLEIREYEVITNNKYYSIRIYVYENDRGYDDYTLYENGNFIIAYNDKAHIRSYDKYLINNYLSIKDGVINTNYDISVNKQQYNNDHLNDNDSIEYLGIKIIYFKDHLYINNFNCKSNLRVLDINEKLIKYPIINSSISYYLPLDIKQLNIEKIKEYNAVKRNNNDDFVKSILTSVLMCLSMSGMAIISYLSNTNQSQITKISYIIMPVSMILTGVLLPLIFFIIDRYKFKKKDETNKNEYLQYLQDYKFKLNEDISDYIDSNNSRFFDLTKAKDRLFYAGIKSIDYLRLSIGKIVIKKDIDIKYTSDKQIDDSLNEIVNTLNNIENYPLFVDINENKIITIVSKRNDKLYTFNKILLELSFKHHYDDLIIAIFSKNDYIFDKIYNLPHLFINNKRLTLINEKQLQELDQMKVDKPIVLLMYDKIDYIFSNDNIHLIYFSEDISDLYKASDIIVEYINNKGYLYKDNKLEFSYIEQHINFDIYFDYLGKLKSISNKKNTYKISDIYDFKIIDNYLKCDNRLNANFAYSNNELLSFDLHESKQGPHGLIGGSTGSGKSELIISLLLSLCIRYSCEYLNIVLIDYKGGGIKESLTYNNITIPHIVASISNLENNTLDRLIICLNNECKKRQELFKELSKHSGISIMNLDEYLNNDYQKYQLRNLGHLLIVVDEFAELKKEHPEQIKELVSLSRIGRSLGLHLILATQKPGGVIDDEIWSNSRFKIALKVFEEKDSQDIIKSKNAAYLTNPGEFLLRVDNGLIKAQSIYCKNDINAKDPYKVSLLDNTLSNLNSYKVFSNNVITEASVYCKNIIDASNSLKLKPYVLDFLPPISKYRKELSTSNKIVLGEVDDYINGYRQVLSYEIDDNILIYSSRRKEINNLLNILNENKRKSLVISNNVYIGSYICDCVDYDNYDDISYLFNYLNNNHDINLSIVIEDVNCFLSYDDSYLDILCKLIKRSDILGISIILLTSSTQISFKLINSFKHKVLINTSDRSDISTFYSMKSLYLGNSYCLDDEVKSFIPIKIEDYLESDKCIDSIIKHIPDVVKPQILDNKYLVGYEISNREKIYVDNNIAIFSLDEDLLNIYKKSYEDLNITLYQRGMNVDNKDILWLGGGIFNQRLFVTNLNDDLDDNDALYIKGNKKYIIRSLNYV